MKNYIKPTANVIEIAVRESLSARTERSRTYSIRGEEKVIKTNIYTARGVSNIDLKSSTTES